MNTHTHTHLNVPREQCIVRRPVLLAEQHPSHPSSSAPAIEESTFGWKESRPPVGRREGQGGQRGGAHQRIGAPDICGMAWRKDQSKEKKTEWKFKSMLSNCIHETLSRVR